MSNTNTAIEKAAGAAVIAFALVGLAGAVVGCLDIGLTSTQVIHGTPSPTPSPTPTPLPLLGAGAPCSSSFECASLVCAPIVLGGASECR